MDEMSVRLTVLFDDPFWIGILESVSGEKLSASRIVFGAEPKEYEVNNFIRENYYRLKFSPAVATAVKKCSQNPKRRQREARKQMQDSGIGTKSQQALKLQQEQMKQIRKTVKHEKREAEKQREFELKQQKKKAKHRGR